MLLQGLLRCGPCDCAMTPIRSTRKRVKLYRYYTCLKVLKRGRDTCPSKSIPAEPIEQFVVDQLRTKQLLQPNLEWELLPAAEQARRVRRWVQKVVYDGAKQTVAIAFYPDASPSLSQDQALSEKGIDR